MAGFFNSSSMKTTRLDTTIWTAKLVLLCVGIISTAVLFKVVVIPFIFNLLISTLPNCWVSFKSWLSPPYIYIIVNFIIITIAASSNFHANQKHHVSTFEETKTAKNQTQPKNQDMQDETWEDMIHQEEEKPDSKSAVIKHCMVSSRDANESTTEDKKVVNHAAVEFEPAIEDDDTFSFGYSEISFMEGNPVRAENILGSSNEEDDTLDATWKAIMEGQGKMVRKQLKKSETWNKPAQLVRAKPTTAKLENDVIDSVAWAKKEFRKSDTFNDSVSLRREKSLSQDELNKRVESFIKKMKLQRLESEHQQRLIEKVSDRCVY